MKKFFLNSDVILRAEPQYYDTYAAFNYRRIETAFLTKKEYEMLEGIAEEAAEKDILIKRSEMKPEEVTEFLTSMNKSEFIQYVDEPPKVERPGRRKIEQHIYEKFPIPFLSAPTSIDLFITNRCNLRCVHCFAYREDGTKPELSYKELMGVFDQLEALRVFEVRINGGEPLMHPEITEILADLKKRRFRTVLLTNGSILNDEHVKLLQEGHITPTVSLDDSKAEGHDRFRGVKGSFQKTVEALRLLKKHKIEYGINTCLHKNNEERYEEIIKLAVKYSASRIAFLDLKPSARLNQNKEWIPSYEEYEKMLIPLTIARLKYRRKIDVALDVFLICQPLEESIQEAKRGYVSCSAGKKHLSIDSDGMVYPCNLVLADPYWKMGDIKNEKLWDIWFSKKWLPFRGGIRIEDLTKCKDCKERDNCLDFYCRLHPYNTLGDPLAPHPRCLKKKEFI